MNAPNLFPIEITKKEFMEKCAYGDGICKLCGAWLFDKAEPMAENVFCDQCENRSVVGLKKAEKEGLVRVTQ